MTNCGARYKHCWQVMKKLIWVDGVINCTQVKCPIDGIMDVQMSLLS